MNRLTSIPAPVSPARRPLPVRAFRPILALILILAFVPSFAARAQVLTVDTGHPNPIGIDRRYAQVEPTSVALPQQPMDAVGHQELLRAFEAEQGFAMRPFPRGKKGLVLAANGKLTPSGESYVNLINEQGLSVKAGERVVLSNVRIDKDRIVFDINGGPEHKHEFLRHVQVGMGGPDMTSPVVQDDGREPTGARLSLSFEKFVPGVTPAQVKALLAPLISFDVKTPVQAFTDTLPPQLKSAILGHHVLVGMSTEMVLYAMGQPESKSREIEGQTPFEEWIYGHAPQDVQFVRINGNRVIRVALAKLGQPLEISTKDEVEGLMTTDGKPVLTALTPRDAHTIRLGDTHPDLDKQAPTAPPSLRKPGEKLPSDDAANRTAGRDVTMKPVVFPKDTTGDSAHTVDAHTAAKPAADSGDAAKPDPPPAAGPADPEKSDPQPGSAPTPPASNVLPARL